MMTKKNPVYLTVLLVALAIVITFQVTFVCTEVLDRDDRDPVGDGAQSGELISEETYRKLREIASR